MVKGNFEELGCQEGAWRVSIVYLGLGGTLHRVECGLNTFGYKTVMYWSVGDHIYGVWSMSWGFEMGFKKVLTKYHLF